MLLDIIIPIIKIDAPTFINNLEYLKLYLPFKRFVLIGASEVESLVKDIPDVCFFHEDQIYSGMTLQIIKEIKTNICGSDKRSGWYFQQFLKMAYAYECKDPYYLIWDSDTIPIRKLDFFSKGGKPYLAYRNYVKFDECFFRTQNRLLPNEALRKNIDDSFITEHMLVDVHIMKNLIDDIEKNQAYKGRLFYAKILEAIEDRDINLSGFSEFEAYAAYVLKYYPNIYKLRFWKNLRNGRIIIGNNPSKGDLQWVGEVFDVVSIEDFDKQWVVSKLILSFKKHIRFSTFYRVMKPCIFYMETLRQFIRNRFLK